MPKRITKKVKQVAAEVCKDPLAMTPSVDAKRQSWTTADVWKSITSAVIMFFGAAAVPEFLQLVIGHSKEFGPYGALVSAVAVLLLQLWRTFHQGEVAESDVVEYPSVETILKQKFPSPDDDTTP